MIVNPILRGFNPDPSIVRVNDDYYIATSTFEWFPGVQIHHSRDLKHWRLLTRPLHRVSQLDLRGAGASQGVWAPCLTYDKGTFFLVYTVVTAFYCNMYDTHNYIVTAPDIMGPWSEPAEISSFGFDPSLFHDDNGRKYMVMMVTDHRVPKKYAGRLIVQEYDPIQKKMAGNFHEVYQAHDIFLEGPHIFKRNGWYYLFCADITIPGTLTWTGENEISWSLKMAIKNELFGENRLAIEVFPKSKNLVDIMDVYHLWVFPKEFNLPFGIHPTHDEQGKWIKRGCPKNPSSLVENTKEIIQRPLTTSPSRSHGSLY